MSDFSWFVTLRATLLLKENIDGLLRQRGYQRKDLAQWCHRTEGWISKIFRNQQREIPLKYLDRIADFFGLTTFQLFQPGIVHASERRAGLDRRARIERRLARRSDETTQTSKTRAQPMSGDNLMMEIADLSAQLHQLAQQLAEIQNRGNQPKTKIKTGTKG